MRFTRKQIYIALGVLALGVVTSVTTVIVATVTQPDSGRQSRYGPVAAGDGAASPGESGAGDGGAAGGSDASDGGAAAGAGGAAAPNGGPARQGGQRAQTAAAGEAMLPGSRNRTEASDLHVPNQGEEVTRWSWRYWREPQARWTAEQVSRYWVDPSEISLDYLVEQNDQLIEEMLRSVP